MADTWCFPRLIAHRGGGKLAPENTLAGMQMAVAKKFSAVEFDVKLSADGELILLHDDTLQRTTNGSGSPAQKNYAEIAKLDAGSWFDNRFAGEPVPTYAAVAQYCRRMNVSTNVEIKPNPGQEEETGRAVAESTRRIWGADSDKVLLSSFSEKSLAAARDAAPEFGRGLLADPIPRDWKHRLVELECISLHCNYRNITADLAAEIRAENYRLLCYTVNDPSMAKKLFAWAIDAIFTDSLDTITPDLLSEPNVT